MKKFLKIAIILITLISSCASSPDQLQLFDKQKWTEDTNGCNGDRSGMVDNLMSQKEKILSLRQGQVKSLLGTPDKHELYERTRKFFHYYLEPSNLCDSSLTANPRTLQIRFNALGLCNEVFIKNDD